MSEHTPGPWIASHRHSLAGPHDDELNGLGWDIEGPPEPMLRGQFAKAADAYIIAAAPELLAACEALVESERWKRGQEKLCEKIGSGDGAICDTHWHAWPCPVGLAVTAIAKAKPTTDTQEEVR